VKRLVLLPITLMTAALAYLLSEVAGKVAAWACIAVATAAFLALPRIAMSYPKICRMAIALLWLLAAMLFVPMWGLSGWIGWAPGIAIWTLLALLIEWAAYLARVPGAGNRRLFSSAWSRLWIGLASVSVVSQLLVTQLTWSQPYWFDSLLIPGIWMLMAGQAVVVAVLSWRAVAFYVSEEIAGSAP
jgi:hypothetical protein